MVGTKPYEDRGEQGERVGRAGQDGAQPFAGKVRDDVLAFAERRRLDQQPPHRRHRVARRRLHPHRPHMFRVAFRDDAEIVLDIEPDRKPRRVGGERQHVEADIRRQLRPDILDRQPVMDRLQDLGDFSALFLLADGKETREDIFRRRAVAGIARLCPEDRRGITDLDAVAAVFFEEAVERGRIGEGRCFLRPARCLPAHGRRR